MVSANTWVYRCPKGEPESSSTRKLFAGWKINDGTTIVDLEKQGYQVTDNVTFHAVYAQAIKLTFKSGEGAFDDEDPNNYDASTMYYNAAQGSYIYASDVSEVTSPSGNKVFYGWATDPEGSNIVLPADGKMLVEDSVTLYAIFRDKEEAHVHTPSVLAGREATCEETGLTEGSVCSTCGTVIVAQTVIPALPGMVVGSVAKSGAFNAKVVSDTEVSVTAFKKIAKGATFKLPNGAKIKKKYTKMIRKAKPSSGAKFK